MLKNKAMLELTIGTRIYQVLVPNDAPLGECFDALTEMRHYIVSRIRQHEEEERQEGVRMCVGENSNACES